MGILDGKAALITGAGQGVGQGIAFTLAKEGCQVAVIGRTESKLVDTCNQIEAFGGRAIPIAADVTDKAQVDHSIAATVEAFGRLDILINNAAIVALAPVLKLADEDLERVLAGSALSTLRYMRGCYPYLKAAGDGAVLNLTSGAPRRWLSANFGFYAASKRAVEAVTRSAACEWGPDNIRVNAIAPVAMSPGLKGRFDINAPEVPELLNGIPLGRVGDCEDDIGPVALFLVSGASRYVTGAIIPVDGGHAYFG